MPTTTVADQIRARLQVRQDLQSPDQRRALREAAGLTQQELADIVGVTRNTISSYELGTRTPQAGRARERYAAALRAISEALALEAA